MHDHSGWYLNLGRWAGVRVKLHASFAFLAVLLVYLATRQPEPPLHAAGYALLTTLLLFASVLLHVFGHCLASWRLGGSVSQVMLTPLGGLHSPQLDGEPQDEMRIAMAGPTANLLVCIGLLPLMWTMQVDLLRLFHVLRPPEIGDRLTLQLVLETVFYLNWVLTIVNLIPALPLDGGRILRAALTPSVGATQASFVTARTGQLVALIVLVLPLLAWGIGGFEAGPQYWAPVAVLSIVMYFSAKQEIERMVEPDPEEAGPFGYDFSQGYTSLERRLAPPTPRRKNAVQRWLERRRRAREQRRLEIETQEEQRLDGILARLNEVGMDNLSPEERDILRRVSQRYRNRH